MHNRLQKLALVLTVAYLGAGIIIFPSWWYLSLSEGPEWLWYAATHRFLLWNLIAIAAIGIAILAYDHGLRNSSMLATRAAHFLNSPSLIRSAIVLFVLASTRLLFHGLESSRVDALQNITEIKSSIEKLELTRSSDAIVRQPIELLYINRSAVDEFYAQIKPQLELKAKTIDRSRKDSRSGKLDAKVAEVAAAGEDVTQSKEDYAATELPPTSKLIAVAQRLKSDGELFQIQSIDLQSKDLSAFDESVALLRGEYKLPLPDQQVREIRQRLTIKALATSKADTFKVNGWFIIHGEFSAAQRSAEHSLTFSYVPTWPEKIQFLALLDSKLMAESSLRQLSPGGKITASVFGRITSKSQFGEKLTYQFTPYAVFR